MGSAVFRLWLACLVVVVIAGILEAHAYGLLIGER